MHPSSVPHSRLVTWKTLIRLAFPLALAQFFNYTMQIIDSWFVGKIGVTELGGLSLGNGYFAFFMVGGFGILGAMEFHISFAIGAKTQQQSFDDFIQGVFLMLFYSLAVIPIMIAGGWMMRRFGVDPAVIPDAERFIFWVGLSLFPSYLFLSLRSLLQCYGVTAPQLIVVIAANGLNFVLDAIFVPGKFGIPAMGVRGAAIATLISRIIMAGILCFWTYRILKSRPETALLKWNFEFRSSRAWKILKMAGPTIGQLLFEVGIFVFSTFLAGRLGPIQLSSHHLVLSFASLVFMIPLGFSSAATVLVGKAYGARDFALLRLSGNLALLTGGAIAFTAGLVIWIFGIPLLSSFNSDPQVVNTGASLLLIVLAFQVFDATQVISAGCLRGIGSTRTAFMANLLGHWFVALPVMLYASQQARYGIFGIWMGLMLGLVCVATSLIWYWRRRSGPMLQALLIGDASA